jgi:hypothetical protein
MSTAAPDLADKVLRTAQAAAYRFPLEFTGFHATVRTSAGDTGAVTVSGERQVTVELPDGAADAEWVRDQVTSITGHRWSRYEDGDGKWRKRLDGDRVEVLDDPFDSSYRVADGAIAEVHRTMGDDRFAILIGARTPAVDGRWLPACFTVVHWSVADGRLIRTDVYRDEYVYVGDVHLPSRREVTSATDAGLITRTLELTGHEVIGRA